MDRCGTRTSVTLHKFAKVLWLKLRRDISVMDSVLRIAAVNTKPMSIEEIDSDEEGRTRLRWKKETQGMDDTVEVPPTRGSEGSEARGSRDPVTHPVETSIAQRIAPDLVLWSDEPGGLLEPGQEESKARGKNASSGGEESQRKERPNWSKSSGEGHARAHGHEFPQLVLRCSYCVRARAADIHITDNHTKSQSSRTSWRTFASCRMHLAVSCSRTWTC